MSTSKKTKTTTTSDTVHASAAPATTASDAPAATAPEETAAAPPATATPALPTVSAILAAKIASIIALLKTIAALLGTGTEPAQPLTIEQRRAVPKVRTGGDALMPAVLDLIDQYGIVIPGGGTAEARAAIALIALLQPLELQLTSAANLVSDVISEARGSAWETTMTGYSMLVRLQKRFPALQTELDAFASFLATKHKSAPTILRQAEAKTLSRTRATLKDKKAAGSPAPVAAAEPVAAAPSTPIAPVAPSTNGANGTSSGSGTSHA